MGWTNPVPPELSLLPHMAQTAHSIERSAAFASEYLTGHRRRVNLSEKVAPLSRDSCDLWIERRDLSARDDIDVADTRRFSMPKRAISKQSGRGSSPAQERSTATCRPSAR